MKPKLLTALLLGLTVFTVGCSDDKPVETAKPSTTSGRHHPVTDNVRAEGEASNSLKEKFSKAFSKACVARELKSSNNPEVDEPRLRENCDCIAEHLADDLAEVDAEKYLQDHEDTQALAMRFDAAAFFCLQNKPQPKGPHLFGRQ